MDQIKHIAAQKEEDMVQCHLLERKRLPKILKSDTKTRTMMYRESLRITGGEFTMEMERERMKQVTLVCSQCLRIIVKEVDLYSAILSASHL